MKKILPIIICVMLILTFSPKAFAADTLPFGDISPNDYYYDAVRWAYYSDSQITDGTSATTFSPNQTCTRGQVVTFLWRSAGNPEPVAKSSPFTDVRPGDYFFKPVLWAVENGITDGTSDTTFSPSDTCRNSHILTFIYRAVGEPGKTGQGTWYSDAYNWAYYNDILTGSYTGTYDITGFCSRGSVIQYLYKHYCLENPAAPEPAVPDSQSGGITLVPSEGYGDPPTTVYDRSGNSYSLPQQSESGITYMVNLNTKKFHYMDCSSVRKMSEKNKYEYQGSREDLIDRGYEPCKICNP